MVRKIIVLLCIVFIASCSSENLVGVQCVQDSECETPMEYLVQSNCPFGSACIQNTCEVVCPFTEHAQPQSINKSYPISCETDSDCNCANREPKSKACVCHNGACLSVE